MSKAAWRADKKWISEENYHCSTKNSRKTPKIKQKIKTLKIELPKNSNFP